MADVQVLVGGSATVAETFAPGGVPTDLDGGAVPAVTLTRPDGTAGPASGTVTHVQPSAQNPGAYQFELDGQAQLTVLTALWEGDIGGNLQKLTSRIEIVGGLLFTLTAAKAWDQGAIPAAGVSDTQILDMRRLLTDDLEQAHRCNVAFVPRFTRETHDASGGDLLLWHQRATELLSVTVDGAAQNLAGWYLDPSGILRTRSGYQPGSPIRPGIGNVTVEYIRGWPQCPGPVSQAALRVARALLVPSNVGDRATSITNDAGTILLATAGRGTYQPYGIPLADSVFAAYSEPLAA